MKSYFQRSLLAGGISAVAIASTLAVGAESAVAASIKMQGAVGVTTNLGALPNSSFGGGAGSSDINNIINKSGLQRAYTNGEDQAAYLGSTDSYHSDRNTTEWFGAAGNLLGYVDFDLGQSYDLANMVLWNEDVFGVKGIGVWVSNNAGDFGNATSGWSFVDAFTANNPAVAPVGSGPAFLPTSQILDFGGVLNARYVRLGVDSGYDYEFPNRDRSTGLNFKAASIGEVAFGVHDPIPTPALIPGLVGMGMGVWRKKKRQPSA